jgi:hypothetical protein
MMHFHWTTDASTTKWYEVVIHQPYKQLDLTPSGYLRPVNQQVGWDIFQQFGMI